MPSFLCASRSFRWTRKCFVLLSLVLAVDFGRERDYSIVYDAWAHTPYSFSTGAFLTHPSNDVALGRIPPFLQWHSHPITVDLSHLKETQVPYSLFPGQMVAMEGRNVSGRTLLPTPIVSDASPPTRKAKASEWLRLHHDVQEGNHCG